MSLGSVLITGGGTGIGRATAEFFLEKGHRVIVVGRRLKPLQSLRSPNVLALTCDVANPSSVDQLAQDLRARPDFASSLSILVNNAGIFERTPFATTSDETWSRLFGTNLLGAVRITRTFLPELEKNQGVVVNVSSNLGLKPIPDTSAYSALKAAMINWTLALALELGEKKIRANCICPGIVDTPIHPFHGQSPEAKASLQNLQPLGRIGEPRDIAHGIYSVAGPGSEWMTGAVVTIDGGIILK